MSWFKNMRIRSKLILSFSIVIIFSVVLAVMAIITVFSVDSSYSYLLDTPQTRYQMLRSIQINFNHMRRSANTSVLFSGQADSIDKYSAQFDQAYGEAVAEIDKYVDSNNRDALVNQLADSALTYINDVSAANTNQRNMSILVFAGLTLFIVVCSVLIALFVSWQLSKPMKRLVGVAESLAEGSLDVNRMEVTKDEIGHLSGAFQKMIDVLRSLLDDVNEMTEERGKRRQGFLY